jgi:CheY-like chemotaxis protein
MKRVALDAMRDCDLDDQMKFLNMPRLDGREALPRIRADESLRRIPVVGLTTSTMKPT